MNRLYKERPGEPINWQAILSLIIGDKTPEATDHFLFEALAYLDEAYGKQKRRLGPLAILHPIRTVALLAKAKEHLSTLDLLTALLHDKNEDILPEIYDNRSWQRLEKKYHSLLARIDANANWFLNERIHFLTKYPNQQYHDYLGRLLEQAKITPELAAIKLADRLDNTLDLRIDLHDFTDHTHCYQTIFDILFVNCYQGFSLQQPHPVSGKINGSMRLYQLYKNAVFLSILRDMKIELDHASQKLFPVHPARYENRARSRLAEVIFCLGGRQYTRGAVDFIAYLCLPSAKPASAAPALDGGVTLQSRGSVQ